MKPRRVEKGMRGSGVFSVHDKTGSGKYNQSNSGYAIVLRS